MFFLDTYALIEIIKGNYNYTYYFDRELYTTRLNLMELYYYFLREYNEDVANYYYKFFLPTCIPISDFVIRTSMKFKLKYKKKGFSYVDCVGYLLAFEQNIKFLTGDKAFKGLPNVEFIR